MYKMDLNIGRKLKKFRIKKKYTLRQLSELSGISVSFISDIENGRRNPSIDTLNSIAKALNVSVDRLLGESVSSIIENRIKELNITLEDLAERAGVSVEYLNKIDNIYPDQHDYLKIDQIAKALEMQPGPLRTALAKQEPPTYDESLSSPEDDFFELSDSKPDKNKKLSKEVNSIEDSDLRAIARARKKMTNKDKEKMMQILKISFEEYFNDNND